MQKSEQESTENEFSDMEPRFNPVKRRDYLDSGNEETKTETRRQPAPRPPSRNIPIPIKASKFIPSDLVL